ncbi:hypothetical protein, partial [Bacteroides ovatus]|uniref:hypothetical protein n=1 Tax=Bacteroides ovatus TaxID=28116 RepID=UPI00202DD1A8
IIFFCSIQNQRNISAFLKLLLIFSFSSYFRKRIFEIRKKEKVNRNKIAKREEKGKREKENKRQKS